MTVDTEGEKSSPLERREVVMSILVEVDVVEDPVVVGAEVECFDSFGAKKSLRAPLDPRIL